MCGESLEKAEKFSLKYKWSSHGPGGERKMIGDGRLKFFQNKGEKGERMNSIFVVKKFLK